MNGSECAIKVVDLEVFESIFAAMGLIKDLPERDNIVKYHRTVVTGYLKENPRNKVFATYINRIYQVMDYVPGIDLSIFLNKGMNFKVSIEANLCIINDILNGLNFLHQNDLVHRNINPENILLHKNGTVITYFCIIKINFSRQR